MDNPQSQKRLQNYKLSPNYTSKLRKIKDLSFGKHGAAKKDPNTLPLNI